jgi:hypothetical protein
MLIATDQVSQASNHHAGIAVRLYCWQAVVLRRGLWLWSSLQLCAGLDALAAVHKLVGTQRGMPSSCVYTGGIC